MAGSWNNLIGNNIDVEFSIPARQKLRFTRDLARGELDVLLEVLEPGGSGEPRVFIVVDASVAENNPRIGELVAGLQNSQRVELVTQDLSGGAYVLEGGESIKNTTHPVQEILEEINRRDLDRRSYVVAIGGGAVLDAVGFAAAVAHRGVRLVRIPTTTLAQDDSGVGVKNAINCFGKKNWIGSFAVPWAVINDAGLLESLPDRDFRSGFSEAVKVSLLKSPNDFDFLCEHARRICDREMEFAFEAIQKSCILHLDHITRGGDPFEALEARPLDFGHWSAHKIECITDYEIRHGEAVGIGVALDCVYSTLNHGLPEEVLNRVCRCLSDLGLSLWHPVLDNPAPVLEGLEEFRQHLGGRLTVTMLQDVGRPIDVHEVDSDLMCKAICNLKELANNPHAFAEL